MTSESLPVSPLDPQAYQFYTPEPGRCVEVGAENLQVLLPQIPLPILREDLETAENPTPSDDAIGKGIYGYLRQFPDCPLGVRYAELLRDAYPHFLADLAAQIAMLDYKEVDAPYVRRKVTFMKILALLEPENPRLLASLGLAGFDLGLMFSELPHCRQHLLAAMGFLQRALRLAPDDVALEVLLGRPGSERASQSSRRERLTYQRPLPETGEHLYALEYSPPIAGRIEYRVRAYPASELLTHPFEMGMMAWL